MKKNSEYTRGINAAYRAIARRDCSIFEIRELLKRKEIEEEVQEEIIEVLARDKYLDDERFTASVIRSKKEYKRDGPLKIRQFLLQKGIKESMIDRFMQNHFEEEEEIRIMQELLDRKRVPEKKNLLQKKQYLYNFLMNKGFPSYKVLEAIENHLKKNS